MCKGESFLPEDRPTAKRIRRLLEMQEYRCALTGLALSPEDANLDHIIPVAAGGAHEMGNVQVVHRKINQMKSALPNDEFIRWCLLVSEHANRSKGE